MNEPRLIEVLHDGFVRLETWDVGRDKPTEVVRTTDSVSGVLVDIVGKRVLLVSQRRVPMIREDNPTGRVIETVAGRFDVDLGPKELLIKEALEEAGVTLTEGDVHLINEGVPMSLSCGVLSERAFGAVAMISPEQVAPGDTGLGAKDEGEDITRIWLSYDTFIHPRTVHTSWRTWAFAQHLRTHRMHQILEAQGVFHNWIGDPVDLRNFPEPD